MNVKATKNGRSATVEFEFGATIEEAQELFGTEPVYKAYIEQVVIKLQGVMRRAIDAGKSDDEIAAIAAEWKPGAVTKGDGLSSMLRKAQSVEDLETIVAMVEKKIAEKKAALAAAAE